MVVFPIWATLVDSIRLELADYVDSLSSAFVFFVTFDFLLSSRQTNRGYAQGRF